MDDPSYTELMESLIVDFVNKSGKISPWIDRKIDPRRRAAVMDRSSFLKEELGLSTRVRILMDGHIETPKCYCGNHRKYNKFEFRFRDYCSNQCAQKSDEVTNRRISSHEAKYGVKWIMQNKELRKKALFSKHGFYIPEEEYPDKKRYFLDCMKVTNSQNTSTLPNHNKRGRIDLNIDAHHLDHIVSIAYGYVNGISPDVIGHICNLRFIPCIDNLVKNSRCDMSVDELMEKIQTHSRSG